VHRSTKVTKLDTFPSLKWSRNKCLEVSSFANIESNRLGLGQSGNARTKASLAHTHTLSHVLW